MVAMIFQESQAIFVRKIEEGKKKKEVVGGEDRRGTVVRVHFVLLWFVMGFFVLFVTMSR